MNKKIISALILLIVAVSISAASASFLDDIFGSPKEVDIGGVKFTIPAGFDEVSSKDVGGDMINHLKEEGYNITFKSYENDPDFYAIIVTDVNNSDFNKSMLDVNKTTIDGKNGSIEITKDYCAFTYLDSNNKLIYIGSNNKENIETLFKA